MLRVANNIHRTHYKAPRSQANSSSDSPLRSEFFISDAPTLGRLDPLAWDHNNSISLLSWMQIIDITTDNIQKFIEHGILLPEMSHSFSFPFCKSVVPLHKMITPTRDEIEAYLSGIWIIQGKNSTRCAPGAPAADRRSRKAWISVMVLSCSSSRVG
jgi:hypothetical protein